MENAEVARVLAEMADLLGSTGGEAPELWHGRRAAQVICVVPGSGPELRRMGAAGVPSGTPASRARSASLAGAPRAASRARACTLAARRSRHEAKHVLNTLPAPKPRRRLARRVAPARRAPGR